MSPPRYQYIRGSRVKSAVPLALCKTIDFLGFDGSVKTLADRAVN